jgi:hypothetical protein
MNPDATLAKLLEGWLDGGLPETEQAELLRLLDRDPDLRRRFAGQVALLGATRAAADAHPRWLALFDLMERDDGASARSFASATMERIGSDARRARRGPRFLGRLAAALVLLLAAAFLFRDRGPGAAAPAGGDPPPAPAQGACVAVVTGGSPGSGRTTGTYLPPGPISLKHGWITLQTLMGVSVTLDAPFDAILLDHQSIRLTRGRARVRVPEGAEGFRLESPAFHVVDLGTEFAAKVNEDGTGTCRVFEGKADVELLDSVGEVQRSRRLAANESVRISPSGASLQAIEENDSDYPAIKQPPRAALLLAPSYARRLMEMRPAGYWRFESIIDGIVPNEVAEGIPLHAKGPYAVLSPEAADNHSGSLTQQQNNTYFKLDDGGNTLLAGDFTVTFFVQLPWLQNFALVSAMHYDDRIRGHSFILQCYASLYRIGIDGSALHCVLRDPPAWDGGSELVGAAHLTPLRWHHIAATRRDGVAVIHLDAREVAREVVGTMPLDAREIFVGRLNGNPDTSRAEARGLVGHLDELAVFPRALGDDELRILAAPAGKAR